MDEWLDIRSMVLMHFDHITKFTLMDCLYFMEVLRTIYGHTQLVFKRIKLLLPVVHVTQEAQTRFHPMLAVTTTVSLGIMVAVLMLCSLMSYGMDSSVEVWRLPAAHTPTCRGSSRHSTRTPLTTLTESMHNE